MTNYRADISNGKHAEKKGVAWEMFSPRARVRTGGIIISFIALTAHINPKQAEY